MSGSMSVRIKLVPYLIDIILQLFLLLHKAASFLAISNFPSSQETIQIKSMNSCVGFRVTLWCCSISVSYSDKWLPVPIPLITRNRSWQTKPSGNWRFTPRIVLTKPNFSNVLLTELRNLYLLSMHRWQYRARYSHTMSLAFLFEQACRKVSGRVTYQSERAYMTIRIKHQVRISGFT